MKYLFSTKLRTSSKLEAFHTFILKSARRALSPTSGLLKEMRGNVKDKERAVFFSGVNLKKSAVLKQNYLILRVLL